MSDRTRLTAPLPPSLQGRFLCYSHRVLRQERVLATHRHRLNETRVCAECAEAFEHGSGPLVPS